MGADYREVTEVPGSNATAEQLSRLYTRYHMAAKFSVGKDVLEVACGPGFGLNYLARTAHRVVGGDYTQDLLVHAQRQPIRRVPVLRLDAHKLPFGINSFDVILLFEAIYYLTNPDTFLDECQRVLRPNGMVLICTANKEWPGFSPSPLSKRYFSASELFSMLSEKCFRVELFGAFPTKPTSIVGKVVELIRSAAVSLHLIPRTMQGKELLKRIFYGPLWKIKADIEEGMAKLAPLMTIPSDSPNRIYKVIFVIGHSN